MFLEIISVAFLTIVIDSNKNAPAHPLVPSRSPFVPSRTKSIDQHTSSSNVLAITPLSLDVENEDKHSLMKSVVLLLSLR